MPQKQTKKEAPKATAPTRMRARDYRRKASEIVKVGRGDFAVAYLVHTLIQAGATCLFGVALFFTTGALDFGCIHLAKRARDNHEKPVLGNLFYGFKERYGQSLGVYILTGIFTLLWSLLLIIPGIIKSYAYAMTAFIAYDNPNKTVLDCITESRKLMKGNKWKLFCLEFSYIGWNLLVVLTLGILGFWVGPKITQARYEFYLHISNKD